MLIINADDWGGNRTATDNSMVCFEKRRITSVSAMVFMEDSQRAAEVAQGASLETGLHLNFTEAFNGKVKSTKVRECQQRTASFLKRSKYCCIFYNPVLRRDFRYLYSVQQEEYWRLYHKEPSHINGHHHMHLSANVLLDKLIPNCSKVRRNFSFRRSERSVLNRLYRSVLDRWLARKYECTDYLFSMPGNGRKRRLGWIVELSKGFNVELMVHPARRDEYEYLLSDEYMDLIQSSKVGSFKQL